MKTQFKRIRKPKSFRGTKDELYWAVKKSLDGWELFSLADGTKNPYNIYHFRKILTTKSGGRLMEKEDTSLKVGSRKKV